MGYVTEIYVKGKHHDFVSIKFVFSNDVFHYDRKLAANLILFIFFLCYFLFIYFFLH